MPAKPKNKKPAKKQDPAEEKPKKKIDMFAAVTASLQKEYGATAAVMPTDSEMIRSRIGKYNIIPSGSLSYDRMTGIGGIPKGRIMEVFGPYGAGKTGTLICFAAAAQRLGYYVVFIDVEHRLDVAYADRLGMRRDKDWSLILPQSSDMVFNAVDRYIRTGLPVFVVMDSVSALVSRAEQDRDWAKAKSPGVLAAAMSTFLKRVNPSVSKSGSVLAFANQDRMAITSFGGYKTETGGKALPYYSTHRMGIKKGDEIVEDGVRLGFYMEMKFKKTNTSAAPSARKICFKYNHGFWREEELVQIGIQENIIDKAGAWFTYDDVKVQGKEAMRTVFESDKKLANKIEKEIRKAWGMIA